MSAKETTALEDQHLAEALARYIRETGATRKFLGGRHGGIRPDTPLWDGSMW